MKNLAKYKWVLPLLLLAVTWGSYYVATQQAVSMLSVFPVGVVVRFITMLLLGAIMLKKGQLKLLFKTKPVLVKLIVIGILGFLLDLTAFIGLSVSKAGSGTALLKCDILFVNLISVIIYKQKFTWREWAYTLLMLMGVFIVMGIDPANFQIADSGNIFFILSALFVSINAFIIKSVQKDKRVNVENNVIAFYNNFITMVLFFTASIISGTFAQLRSIPENSGLILALVLASLGQTIVYIQYYANLRKFPVWIVKTFLLFMPIVASLLSFVLFGQELTGLQLGGIAIVLAAAFGILYEQRRKEKGKIPEQEKQLN